jgi:hypothetical protein
MRTYRKEFMIGLREPKKETVKLQKAINRLLDDLATYEPESTEYKNALQAYERIMKLQAETSKKGVTPDTIITALAYLGGILIVVVYEEKHVMRSVATSFFPKMLK